MAQIGTHSLAPGSKSLPAELRAAGYHGMPQFAQARLQENLAQVQSRGGVVPPGLQRLTGMSGLGDVCYDAWGVPYGCGADEVPLSTTPTVIPANSPGFDWAGLTNIINASSTDIAKILAASNPGTMYRDPQGNVIYSQPTGNTQNLPIGAGGPSGTFTGPLGTSGSFSGINPSTLMLVAVVGLMFMMMGSRR